MSGVLTDVAALTAPGTGDAAEQGRRRRRSRSRRALGLVLPLALLGIWQAASVRGALNPSLVPSPGKVADSLEEFFFGPTGRSVPGVVPYSGEGWDHIGASLTRGAISYTAALAVGLSVGLALGLSRLVSDLLDPSINALRAVPLYAWLPLVLVWFGIGETSARALIFIGALWPVLIATADSVGRVPQAYIETARMLGTPRRRLWRRVYLPHALPEIVTGLRLSLTLAWMCVIVGELTGTRMGVGAMMNAARESARTDQVIVGILVFAVVGFLADLLLRMIARPFTRWSLT